MAPIHVRWLGAYGRVYAPTAQQAVNAAGRWEVGPGAGVVRSWALQEPKVRVGGALIGFLVDPRRSKILRLYNGDGWTAVNGRVVVYKDRNDGQRRPTAANLMRVVGDYSHDYDEVLGVPHLVGVVVHPSANKRVRRMARRMARLVGLPYLGSTSRAARKGGAA